MRKNPRFIVRFRRPLLLSLVGLAYLMTAFGCRNCSERMCNAIRMLRTQCVVMSNNCCDYPDTEGCGPELGARFTDMLSLVNSADIACRESNLDELRGIWDDVRRVVPLNLLRALCLVYLDLDEWLAGECHPYVNSSAVLSDSDAVRIEIAMLEVPTRGPASFQLGGSRREAPSRELQDAPGGRTFVVPPGSTVHADT